MNFSSLLFQVFDSDVIPQPEVPPTDLAVINTTAYLIIPSIYHLLLATQSNWNRVFWILRREISRNIQTRYSRVVRQIKIWDVERGQCSLRSLHSPLSSASHRILWESCVSMVSMVVVVVALMCLPAHMIENGEWCVSNETSSLEDFGIRTSNTLAIRLFHQHKHTKSLSLIRQNMTKPYGTFTLFYPSGFIHFEISSNESTVRCMRGCTMVYPVYTFHWARWKVVWKRASVTALVTWSVHEPGCTWMYLVPATLWYACGMFRSSLCPDNFEDAQDRPRTSNPVKP